MSLASSKIMSIKWQPTLRQKAAANGPVAGFALEYEEIRRSPTRDKPFVSLSDGRTSRDDVDAEILKNPFGGSSSAKSGDT